MAARAGQVVLGLAVLGTTSFFAARLGINAAAGGRYDAGTALFLSFVSVLATYASAALAAAAALLSVLALARGRSGRAPVAALVVALLPILYLALR
ncbi:MAG TPA: hypothetical protein VFO85_20600 [Vicinamibacteria bacterium]|nr:hypothetical protein [Vicinamibacteria bacterium]